MACSTGMKNGVNMAASCQMDETPFPGCLNYQPWRVPKRSNGTVNKFHGLTFAAFLSRDSRHLLPKLPGTRVQFPPPPLKGICDFSQVPFLIGVTTSRSRSRLRVCNPQLLS